MNNGCYSTWAHISGITLVSPMGSLATSEWGHTQERRCSNPSSVRLKIQLSHKGGPKSSFFSPDGCFLNASSDQTDRLLEPSTGHELRR